MKTPAPSTPSSDSPSPQTPGSRHVGRTPEDSPDADPQMQGEGNITAARRHRKSAENFVASGEVDRAAREAAPDSDEQAQELREAEKAGKAPARR